MTCAASLTEGGQSTSHADDTRALMTAVLLGGISQDDLTVSSGTIIVLVVLLLMVPIVTPAMLMTTAMIGCVFKHRCYLFLALALSCKTVLFVNIMQRLSLAHHNSCQCHSMALISCPAEQWHHENACTASHEACWRSLFAL